MAGLHPAGPAQCVPAGATVRRCHTRGSSGRSQNHFSHKLRHILSQAIRNQDHSTTSYHSIGTNHSAYLCALQVKQQLFHDRLAAELAAVEGDVDAVTTLAEVRRPWSTMFRTRVSHTLMNYLHVPLQADSASYTVKHHTL